MESPSPRGLRAALLAAAVTLTALGIWSLVGRTGGYTDALFEPDYRILMAPAGGPVAEAGFQPGDSVVSVEGIPVVELGMYSRWPRSLSRAPGESLTMTVARDGELVTGEIVFGEQPAGIRRMRLGLFLVLLSFLWSGVWALWAVPSPHSLRLAAIGLTAGVIIPPPHLGTWAGVADHVNVAAEVLLLLLLLRFLLAFPRPKRVAEAPFVRTLLFVPWVVLLGCLLVELLYHPRFYHAFGGVIGLTMLGYALLSLAALIHSWVRTPKGELFSSGVGWVLAGFAAGLGGILLWAVDAILLQDFDIPGTNWAPVLFGLIPMGMLLGVRKAVR